MKREIPESSKKIAMNLFKRQRKKRLTTVISTYKPYTHVLKDDDQNFFRKLNALYGDGGIKPNVLCDRNQVLSYIHGLDSSKTPAWVGTAYNRLNDENQTWPKIPVLSHNYIRNFLRKPQPSTLERPCSKPECISVEMGGFRCRELLLPGVFDYPDIHGWCYLCHVHNTNCLYQEQLGKDDNDIMNVATPVIHDFIVKVDIIGEYRLSQTIQGDGDAVGIFGPFPIFNVNNYTKMDKGRFEESESMVFRLAQKVSKQTEFFHTTQSVRESQFVR